MICETCKKAGRWRAYAEALGDAPLAEWETELLHGGCDWPSSCMCQHRTDAEILREGYSGLR